MKLIAVAALLLVLPEAGVRFEHDGVRVGSALVQGSVVELQSVGPAALLASESSVEALSAAMDVQLAPDRVVRLEPGVRVSRTADGFCFSAHGARPIRFATEGEAVLLESPVTLSVAAAGWDVGGAPLAGTLLRVGLQNQDDTDANLDRMKQSTQRMKQQAGVPKLSGRTNRRFRGNPLSNAEAADGVSVRQIPQVSASGSP